MVLRVNIEEYLSSYEPKISKLALNIRNKILDINKDIDENIKWKNLVYEKNGYLFAILIHKNHVNLEFWRGVELDDPKNLIEGTGERMRHVKIKDNNDFNSDVELLIKQAISLNSKDV